MQLQPILTWLYPPSPPLNSGSTATKLVFLTFDDGGAGGYQFIAGELERRGWRGYFFITTDWIGRPGFLTRGEIRELHQRGHVIGSHTVSHPPSMSALSWPELIREWTQSRKILGEIIDAEIRTAAVANGYYSPVVGRSAAASGIDMLFRSLPAATPALIEGCLVLGRYSMHAGTPASEAGAIAAGKVGVRWRHYLAWRAKGLAKSLAGRHYLALRERLVAPKSKRVSGR